MTQVSELTVKIGTEGADVAEAVLGRIADAAERAKAAIDSLNGAAHGGISIKIVGNLATVDIEPPSGDGAVDVFASSIRAGGDVAAVLEREYGLKRVGR